MSQPRLFLAALGFSAVGVSVLLLAVLAPIDSIFRFCLVIAGVFILWLALFLFRRPPQTAGEFLAAFGRYYGATASIAFTAGVCFLVMNVALAATLKLTRWMSPKTAIDHFALYGDRVYEAYAGLGLSRAQVEQLLIECFQRPVVFDSFTQFKERPFRGEFVNVYPEGFRDSRNSAPWPPSRGNLNVFVFGGSTTFGYGVPDDQTIPAHLQRAIDRSEPSRRVMVYNFGAGFYFSTQERILFENLLLQGLRPDVAVFIDGLNDVGHPTGDAYHTQTLEQMMERRMASKEFFLADPGGLLENLPIRMPIDGLMRRLASSRAGSPGDEPPYPPAPAGPIVLDRYATNQRIIRSLAADFGIHTVFVWQPIPAYAYDLKYDLFRNGVSIPDSGPQRGYEAVYRSMAARLKVQEPLPDFLYLAEIQSGRHANFYIDGVHYTPEFSAEIAHRIFEHMTLRELI